MLVRYISLCLLLHSFVLHGRPLVTRSTTNLLTNCELCNILLTAAKYLLESNRTSSIATFGKSLCRTLHLADDAVCNGMIDEYDDVLIDVLRSSRLSTEQLCGVTFACMSQADIPELQWNITLPTLSSTLTDRSFESTSMVSILHLADLHIDVQYRPGSNANCGRPLCCRDGSPTQGDIGAGFWGDYRLCDLPLWTAEIILNHINQNEHDIDWIYFTGDIAPHDVWQQTKDKNDKEISFTIRLLERAFPMKKIYPCVGNHEAAPADLFEPDNMPSLYDELASQWIERFHLDQQTRATIIKGGYYTTMVTSTLRLISLNMNYCTANNYWLLINSTDPSGQLQWVMNIENTHTRERDCCFCSCCHRIDSSLSSCS
jgi:sphingomyelin phosphodiesterase